jgi:uncharacterized protein (TIGR02001 family)
MKKIILTSLVTTALMTQASFAEYKLGSFGTISPSISAASQKYSKGEISNRNQPTASVGLDYNSPMGIYLSASANAENSDPTNGPDYSIEYCLTPGIKKTFDKMSIDLSYENCELGSHATGFFQAKLGFELNKVTNIAVNYYNESTGGRKGADGRSEIGKEAYEAQVSYNTGPATVTAGYLIFDKLLQTASIGVSKEVAGISFDLSYYNVQAETNRSYVSQSTQNNIGTDHIIFSAKKSF